MFEESNTKKHELVGIVFILVGILVFLCLVSYNSGDASSDTSTNKTTADNFIGPIGANASNRLYQAFGFAAFLVIAPLLVTGVKLITGKKIHAKYFKLCGFLLLLSAAAAAFHIVPFIPKNHAFEPGGATGAILSAFLLRNLNLVGTAIVVTFALVIGVLVTTPWSLSGSISRFSSIPDPMPPKPSLKERFILWRERRSARRRRKISVNPKKPATTALLNLSENSATAKSFLAPGSPASAARETTEASNAAPVSAATVQQQPSPPRNFKLPSVELLNKGQDSLPVNEEELVERAKTLADKCAEFDAGGSITQIHPGPVVTTFEFKPDPGVKYSRITGLVNDLCLGIKAESLRIDRIPGKATVGIEVPNPNREIIMLRELIESAVFAGSRSKLTLVLGKLINGTPYVTDLAKMPHLLIAGATGMGKSVALNCMITSILYKATPEEVKFILIDPKCVEFAIYTDIPHLLTPIVTDPGEAANALRWAINEMEVRYKKLARRGVRNIDQYNTLLRNMVTPPAGSECEEPENPLPFLVLIIDELADLMLVSSKEVEASISRLAAKARAVGIHLILATQRPSVDVITGVIKANMPSRVAFKATSKIDSRTIIDGNGAEQLLGDGDMLFVPPGTARLIRVHGAYVGETETQDIVEYLKSQGRPTYDDSVLSYGADTAEESGGYSVDADAKDGLYNEAVRVVVGEGRASTSLLQRRLSIGYGRAAKLVDMMFNNGIVGPADGARPREVLVGLDFLDRIEE